MKPIADEIESDALHALRIRGRSSPASASGLTGRSETDTAAALERLTARGFVARSDAEYFITPKGAELHRDFIEAQRSEVAAALEPAYRRFLVLDVPLKTLFTKWQSVDRDDRDERWGAIEELAVLDMRAGPPLADAGSMLPRFLSYRGRLAAAVDRLRDGDERFFTGVGVDSYHQVWFECHQDFLLTLGIERVSEGSA